METNKEIKVDIEKFRKMMEDKVAIMAAISNDENIEQVLKERDIKFVMPI